MIRRTDIARPIPILNQRRRRMLRRSIVEQLDPRNLLAADIQTFDGSNNNLQHPEWGSTEQAYIRLTPSDYSDGIDSPAGADRLSAREISNLLAAQGEASVLNDEDLSAFVYAWGQFLDHDLDLTDSADPSESFEIPVPVGDPYFDPSGSGQAVLPLTRSEYVLDVQPGLASVREQVNSITAYIDGSQIYGSSLEVANSLRTFQAGELKTSQGRLLPVDNSGFFLAGDVRANENVELSAMQTLFVREHNRIAAQLAEQHLDWNDEQLYQAARRRVIAELQAITFNEFLPALLGPGAIGSYQGYDPNVNPSIANEFATAAYRFGHSMIGTDIEFLSNDGSEERDAVALRDAFFNPDLLRESGIDGIMKYLASDRAQAIDTLMVDDLRNFLFGPPGSGGLDLAAMNIQRGRDHGLADYNAARESYGLPRVNEFSDITSDPMLQLQLEQAYGSVDNIDLWVGGLAEDHSAGASVRPLFLRIIANQFERLRSGDRFWYQNQFRGQELRDLEKTTLAQVIQNNTNIDNLQANVFKFRAEIAGHVVLDNASPKHTPMPDQRLSGISIELIDDSGTVIETTSTDRHGNYRFEHLDLGSYQIRAVLPTTLALANSKAQDITITKGEKIHAVDFVVQSMRPTSPQPPHGRSTNREPTHSKTLVENGGPSLVPIELATQPLQASMFPAKFVRRR